MKSDSQYNNFHYETNGFESAIRQQTITLMNVD